VPGFFHVLPQSNQGNDSVVKRTKENTGASKQKDFISKKEGN
jgi:hypothetical protein